jgi:hypothetical protein
MGFRVPGADEYTGEGYGTLAADQYRVRITQYAIKTGEAVTNQYNPKGEPRVWFTLEPLFIEGDEEAELVDVDGKPVKEGKTLIFFFDPSRLGLQPRVAKSRKFFACAMGIPVEQAVSFDSLEDLAKALVGKELVVDVIVKNGKNAIEDSRPVRKRERRPRPAQNDNPLVAAAQETFKEELGEY